jgi:predicted RecA/RadA family phage recombinase
VAKNRKRYLGRKFELDVSAVNGTGTGDLVKSGDPGAVGQIAFVALTDEDSAGKATVDTLGVYELTVTGKDAAAANVAVAVGDIVYWDNTPGEVNKDGTNGIRLGYALGAVASGAATKIEVRLGY